MSISHTQIHARHVDRLGVRVEHYPPRDGAEAFVTFAVDVGRDHTVVVYLDADRAAGILHQLADDISVAASVEGVSG